MCNNEPVFKRAMKRQGIFIPNRDAAWEGREAFTELLVRYDRCDLKPRCKCKKGPTFQEEEGSVVVYMSQSFIL